jgi:CheY-like chemotaxis protein
MPGRHRGAHRISSHQVREVSIMAAVVEVVVAPSNEPVLIVDDMAEVRWLLAELLTGAGFRTIVAADGREACRLLAEGVTPSAILLDVRMPGMDAWEFLRTAAPAAPVILMSGMEADHLPLLPPGVVAFLDKPLSLDLVLDALRKAGEDRSPHAGRADSHTAESPGDPLTAPALDER